MKKWSLVMILCSVMGCNDASDGTAKPENEEGQAMFPVTAFIAGQVHEVDSLQLPVLKYVTRNNQTDSVLISVEEFRSLAKDFMEPDVTAPSLRKFYKESSFADQSIPSITFTYSTTAPD